MRSLSAEDFKKIKKLRTRAKHMKMGPMVRKIEELKVCKFVFCQYVYVYTNLLHYDWAELNLI